MCRADMFCSNSACLDIVAHIPFLILHTHDKRVEVRNLFSRDGRNKAAVQATTAKRAHRNLRISQKPFLHGLYKGLTDELARILYVRKQVILNLYRSRLDDPSLQESLKDSKTQLQEYLQANKLPLPQYKLAFVEGEEHDQVFHIECFVPSIEKNTVGKGGTRRKAEQAAAQSMYKKLKKD